MSGPVQGDAAFRWTENGQEYFHYLGAQLRRAAPNPRQKVYAHESEDGTGIRRVAIGTPVYDLHGQLRHEGQIEQLEDFIAAGLRGASIDYFPSLSQPSRSYPCVLMRAGEIRTDSDSWFKPRFETDVVLRRIDGGRWRDALAPTLFYYKAGNPLPGLTFTRTGGNAWAQDEDGIFRESADGIFRTGWRDASAPDGIYEQPFLPLDPARTNVVASSADIDVDNSTDWSEDANWNQADVVSVIAGASAVRYTNDGATSSHDVFQDLANTFPSSPVVATLIAEGADAATTTFGIYDNTVGDWVILGTYTWATNSLAVASSGVGSSVGVRRRVLSAVGPNGGSLVELQIYGTPDNSGNAARLYIFPTGTGTNSEAVILHHAQYEEGSIVGSSPIVTSLGASASRAEELFFADFLTQPQAIRAAGGATFYTKFVERGTIEVANAGLWRIGAAGGSNPRLRVFSTGAAYAARYTDANGNTVTATLAVAPSFGQEVEIRVFMSEDGELTIGQSINSGTETTAGPTVSARMTSNWADTRRYLNSDGSAGVGLADILADRGGLGAEKSMAEMRAL